MDQATQNLPRDAGPRPEVKGGGVRWLGSSFLLALVAVVALAGLLGLWFGSIRAASAFLSGDRILIDAESKGFGSIRFGDETIVPFRITNATGRRLTVLGSSTKCPCVVSSGLPMTIPPGGRRQIDVRVTKAATAGPFDQEITVYLDDPAVRALRLRVTGSVVRSATAGGSSILKKEARP